jgi:hypothetical protein
MHLDEALLHQRGDMVGDSVRRGGRFGFVLPNAAVDRDITLGSGAAIMLAAT